MKTILVKFNQETNIDYLSEKLKWYRKSYKLCILKENENLPKNK